MRQSVEILVTDGGEVAQRNAAIAGAGASLPAVDGYFMTASGEPDAELLGEGFKSSVAGWNAARTEDGDAHGRASGGFCAGSGPERKDRLFGSGPAYRLVAEPGGDLLFTDNAAALDQPALGHDAFPVLRQEPEGFERAVLTEQAAADHGQVAHRDGEPVAPVEV